MIQLNLILKVAWCCKRSIASLWGISERCLIGYGRSPEGWEVFTYFNKGCFGNRALVIESHCLVVTQAKHCIVFCVSMTKSQSNLYWNSVWSGGVTDAQFHYREWVLNMNTIDVMKDEKCIVRLFYGSAQPSGWCRQFIAQEQWNRCQPMRKGMTSSLKQSNRFYLLPDKTVKNKWDKLASNGYVVDVMMQT